MCIDQKRSLRCDIALYRLTVFLSPSNNVEVAKEAKKNPLRLLCGPCAFAVNSERCKKEKATSTRSSLDPIKTNPTILLERTRFVFNAYLFLDKMKLLSVVSFRNPDGIGSELCDSKIDDHLSFFKILGRNNPSC